MPAARKPALKPTVAPVKPAPAVPAKTTVKPPQAKTPVASAAAKVVKSVKGKPVKAPAKPAAKPAKAEKPVDKAAEKAADKARKPKLVRDSFTIPKDEYAALDALKARAAKLGRPAKKSEVLRAGLLALTALGDAGFKELMGRVPAIKTGRPSKG